MGAGGLKVGKAEALPRPRTRSQTPADGGNREKVALHPAVDHHRPGRLGRGLSVQHGRGRRDALLACVDGEGGTGRDVTFDWKEA